jgi:hypothetical protein
MEKREFVDFIEEVNKDYKFAVVDMTSQSNNPEDFLMVVKAEPPKEKPINERRDEKVAEEKSQHFLSPPTHK